MAEKKEEKIKINPSPMKLIEVDYNGQKIFINPLISLKDKIMLFQNYVDSFFKDGEVVGNYLDAKYGLIFGITDLCTNIDIQTLDIDEYVGGLWKEITSKISNYNEFMSDIYNISKTIADNNAIVKSVGFVIDKVAGDIMKIVKDMDLSPDGIKNLVGELQNQTKDFNDKYVTPPAVEEPETPAS